MVLDGVGSELHACLLEGRLVERQLVDADPSVEGAVAELLQRQAGDGERTVLGGVIPTPSCEGAARSCASGVVRTRTLVADRATTSATDRLAGDVGQADEPARSSTEPGPVRPSCRCTRPAPRRLGVRFWRV